jgi:hypothetical protein
MSLDDLAQLFTQPPQGMGVTSLIVQGVITSFSGIDGSNTVRVNGATLTNLPMAATGAEVQYQVGDPVMLIVLGNTYAILCKVAKVGSPQFASSSTATLGYFASLAGALPLAYTANVTVTLATATISVPAWANRLTFLGAAEVAFHNTGAQSDVQVNHIMNGNPSGGYNDSALSNADQKFDKFQSGVQPVTPGSIITAQCTFFCQTAGNIAAAQVSGTILFSKA